MLCEDSDWSHVDGPTVSFYGPKKDYEPFRISTHRKLFFMFIFGGNQQDTRYGTKPSILALKRFSCPDKIICKKITWKFILLF